MVWAGSFLKRGIKFLSFPAALEIIINEGTCSFNHSPVCILTPPLRLPLAKGFPQAFIIFLNNVIVVESTKKSLESHCSFFGILLSETKRQYCRYILAKALDRKSVV